MVAPSYRILILSPIVVFEQDGAFFTLDLWARDLDVQSRVATVHLLCPITQSPSAGSKLNSAINVHSNKAGDHDLRELVTQVDVVQLPGNSGWRDSHLARRLLHIAKRAGKTVVLGVSSNRARTAWLNSRNKLVGALKYIDVRTSQSFLARRSDGVFVVGEGLRGLFAKYNPNVFVGIASWITASDLAPSRAVGSATLKLCMASRIEKMKGMHVGVAAVALTKSKDKDLSLVIIGEGPEKEHIQRQIAEEGLAAITTFQPAVTYPQPFLGMLGTMDVVLLTNMNDEQPRLIFDALSQGCLPLCPDAAAYRGLGLDDRLFYRQGDSADLHRAIELLCDLSLRQELRSGMLEIASQFTIDEMHRQRSVWISETVARASGTP